MEYVCDGIMVKPAGDRLVGLGCCVHFQEQRAHVHLVFHARQCSNILFISSSHHRPRSTVPFRHHCQGLVCLGDVWSGFMTGGPKIKYVCGWHRYMLMARRVPACPSEPQLEDEVLATVLRLAILDLNQPAINA